MDSVTQSSLFMTVIKHSSISGDALNDQCHAFPRTEKETVIYVMLDYVMISKQPQFYHLLLCRYYLTTVFIMSHYQTQDIDLPRLSCQETDIFSHCVLI